MPNSIQPQGITIQTLDEIKTEIITGLKTIYGTDINLAPNTPDGQLVNILAQAKIDILELVEQVFNSFDPDQAVGVNLDRRCAINGIKRGGGTYTQQTIDVTVDRPVSLPGLDTNPDTPFTVQDTAGNQYNLVSTVYLPAASTYTLTFQAAKVGPVTSALGTVTTVQTVTLGVLAVNNSASATSIGVAQETDAALRERRARSVAIPSKGYLDGLIGALLDLDGVTQVEIFENVTNVTDLRGIPAHSIWAIVAGGSSDDIARVIYLKRSLGCGMRGDTVVPVVQADGLSIDILFDRPIPQPLYINLNAEAITGVVDIEYLRTQLLAKLSYQINESADSSTVVALAKAIYPNAAFYGEGVSTDNHDFYTLVTPDSLRHQFYVASIDINGAVS